ncbi:hypothetical protein F2P79_018395 [Pimephales promelas]|nr:hypothetical protein F2P79_018395 [Pimephales promelas]
MYILCLGVTDQLVLVHASICPTSHVLSAAGACHRIYNRASPVSRCSCTPASASAQLSSPASSRSSSAVMLSRAVPMAGVTAHKISKYITFFASDVDGTPAASFSPGHPKPILLLLPWLGSRPQAFGGYTFSQVLVHVAKDTQRYQGLTNRIRGHIYDSLVMGSLDHMAKGLGKTLFPRFEHLVRSTGLLYFRLFKHQTVDYFNSAISIFWNTPLMAPSLFFYAENDVLCDYKSLEKMMEDWRNRGLSVENMKWKESIHAGHLRTHPQEYLATLDNFVMSLNMVPLKAKM